MISIDIEKFDLSPGDVVVIRYPEEHQNKFDQLLIICKQLRQMKGIIPLLLPDSIYIKKCSKNELKTLKHDVSLLLKNRKG